MAEIVDGEVNLQMVMRQAAVSINYYLQNIIKRNIGIDTVAGVSKIVTCINELRSASNIGKLMNSDQLKVSYYLFAIIECLCRAPKDFELSSGNLNEIMEENLKGAGVCLVKIQEILQ